MCLEKWQFPDDRRQPNKATMAEEWKSNCISVFYFSGFGPWENSIISIYSKMGSVFFFFFLWKYSLIKEFSRWQWMIGRAWRVTRANDRLHSRRTMNNRFSYEEQNAFIRSSMRRTANNWKENCFIDNKWLLEQWLDWYIGLNGILKQYPKFQQCRIFIIQVTSQRNLNWFESWSGHDYGINHIHASHVPSTSSSQFLSISHRNPLVWLASVNLQYSSSLRPTVSNTA